MDYNSHNIVKIVIMPNSYKLIIITTILIANFWINASQNNNQNSDLFLHVRFKDHIHNRENNNHSWFDSNKKKLEKLGWGCPNNHTYVKVEWLCKNNNNGERHWLMSRLLITKYIIQKNTLSIRDVFNIIAYHPLPQYVCYEYLKDNRISPNPDIVALHAHGCNIQAQCFNDYDLFNIWTPAHNSIPITAFIYDFICLCIHCITIILAGTLFLSLIFGALFYCIFTYQ